MYVCITRNVRKDGVLWCDIWLRREEGKRAYVCLLRGKDVVLEWEVWRGVDFGGYIFLVRGKRHCDLSNGVTHEYVPCLGAMTFGRKVNR